MNDNDLIQLFLPIIKAQLLVDGFTNVLVQQYAQPTQQGIPRLPTVFFQKLYNHRYGWGDAFNQWNPDTMQMDLYERQWHETHFQFFTLVPQNLLQPISYTAGDLANEVASILQSQATRVTLMTSNVGILRVSEITNPYFQDDRDQFEATPTFDFILTSLETRITIVPIISEFVVNIQRE